MIRRNFLKLCGAVGSLSLIDPMSVLANKKGVESSEKIFTPHHLNVEGGFGKVVSFDYWVGYSALQKRTEECKYGKNNFHTTDIIITEPVDKDKVLDMKQLAKLKTTEKMMDFIKKDGVSPIEYPRHRYYVQFPHESSIELTFEDGGEVTLCGFNLNPHEALVKMVEEGSITLFNVEEISPYPYIVNNHGFKISSYYAGNADGVAKCGFSPNGYREWKLDNT
jgi:hypothetical protein